jgi:hypothetical protein
MSLTEVREGQAQSLVKPKVVAPPVVNTNKVVTPSKTVFVSKFDVIKQKVEQQKTVSNNVPPVNERGINQRLGVKQSFSTTNIKPGETVSTSRDKPGDTVYTREQIQQKTANQWALGIHSDIQNRQKMIEQRNRISPTEQYIMQNEGPTWSKGQILTGFQIRGMYDETIKQNAISLNRNRRSEGEFIGELSKYPRGTIFAKDKTGGYIPYENVLAERRYNQVLKEYKDAGPFVGAVRYGSALFLNVANPDVIVKSVGRGNQTRAVFGWESNLPKDNIQRFVAVQKPWYENVIIPMTIGVGIGAVGSLAGKASKVVQFGKKSLDIYKATYTGTKIVGAGLVFGGLGADIGASEAYREKGLMSNEQFEAKILGYGFQFGSMGAGVGGLKNNGNKNQKINSFKQSNKSNIDTFIQEGNRGVGIYEYPKKTVGVKIFELTKGTRNEIPSTYQQEITRLKGLDIIEATPGNKTIIEDVVKPNQSGIVGSSSIKKIQSGGGGFRPGRNAPSLMDSGIIPATKSEYMGRLSPAFDVGRLSETKPIEGWKEYITGARESQNIETIDLGKKETGLFTKITNINLRGGIVRSDTVKALTEITKTSRLNNKSLFDIRYSKKGEEILSLGQEQSGVSKQRYFWEDRITPIKKEPQISQDRINELTKMIIERNKPIIETKKPSQIKLNGVRTITELKTKTGFKQSGMYESPTLNIRSPYEKINIRELIESEKDITTGSDHWKGTKPPGIENKIGVIYNNYYNKLLGKQLETSNKINAISFEKGIINQEETRIPALGNLSSIKQETGQSQRKSSIRIQNNLQNKMVNQLSLQKKQSLIQQKTENKNIHIRSVNYLSFKEQKPIDPWRQKPMKQVRNKSFNESPNLIGFPIGDVSGGGEGGMGSDDWDRYFRKRKFNIGSINQAFGIGMKPMKLRGMKI